MTKPKGKATQYRVLRTMHTAPAAGEAHERVYPAGTVVSAGDFPPGFDPTPEVAAGVLEEVS